MISIIYSPFPNKSSAIKAAKILLNKRLISCANIIQSQSIYEWKGKIENTKEYVLIAKTTKANLALAVNELKAHHPYEIPAILSWNVQANKEYMNWVYKSVNKKD